MLGAEVRVFAGHFQRRGANPLSYQIAVHTGLLKPGYGAMPHGVLRARIGLNTYEGDSAFHGK